MSERLSNARIDRVVFAVGISFLGLWVHELHRVPSWLGFTPDGDVFMLPIAVGIGAWWARRHSSSARLALLAYAAVDLVGGVPSALRPRGLPFVEQSLSHYTVHVIYALCQVPLLVLTFPMTERGDG